jgi:hypothetical protein
VSLRVHEPNITDFEDFAAAATQYGTSLEAEWRDLVAGTFMHELGHTLGLRHGGGSGSSSPRRAMSIARQTTRAS